MSKVDQIIKIAKRELTPVGHHGETGSYIGGLIDFAEKIEKLYSTPLVGNPVCHICDEPYQHVHTEHKFERLCDC